MTVPQPTAAETTPAPVAEAAPAPPAKPEPAPAPEGFKGPTSQAELDRMIDDRLQREIARAKKAGADEAKAQAEAESTRKSQEAQGEFQKLYEAEQSKVVEHQSEINRLKAEIEQRDRNALRDKVAQKHALPTDLWDRLQGDDEKSLEEDAKRLAAVVKVAAPSTEGGTGGGRKSGGKAPQASYQFRGAGTVVPFPDKVPAQKE